MTATLIVANSNTAGARPASGARQPGELYVNMADSVLGFVDAAGNPVDITFGAVPPKPAGRSAFLIIDPQGYPAWLDIATEGIVANPAAGVAQTITGSLNTAALGLVSSGEVTLDLSRDGQNMLRLNRRDATPGSILLGVTDDGRLFLDKGIALGGHVTAPSGIDYRWKDGVHRITNNDGGGNVNIRFGHEFVSGVGNVITQAGGSMAAIIGSVDSAAPAITFQLADGGGAVGSVVTGKNVLVVNTAGATVDGNLWITGTVSADGTIQTKSGHFYNDIDGTSHYWMRTAGGLEKALMYADANGNFILRNRNSDASHTYIQLTNSKDLRLYGSVAGIETYDSLLTWRRLTYFGAQSLGTVAMLHLPSADRAAGSNVAGAGVAIAETHLSSTNVVHCGTKGSAPGTWRLINGTNASGTYNLAIARRVA